MAGPVPTSPEWPPRPPGWWPGGPPPAPVPPLRSGEPGGIGWALIPLMTCGFGTSPAFVYAAARHGSARLGRVAVGYGLATAVVVLAFLANWDALGALLLMVNWVSGSVHAFALRPKLFPGRTARDQLNEHAIEVARHRRALRAQARQLAERDPELANELRIGRPELPRAYDDGGLIDVNHASPAALALLPEVTGEMVERIVRLRAEQGGFVSAAELGVHADLNPDLVNRLAEYVIFLP